jgi:hypothetical protein
MAPMQNLFFGNDMEKGVEMNIKRLTGIILLGGTAVWGCKKLYTPNAVSTSNSYLVVEGVIAAGNDSTIINLNRTMQLTSASNHKPEIGAKVSVDDQQGTSYPLPEVDSGKYAAPPLNLDNSHKYRVSITTTDGQIYVSDYVPVKTTPPVDSVWFARNGNGVNIYSATHDPSNSARYYRWDYTETYIFQTDMESDYIFDPTGFDTLKWSRLRTPAEQIHTCYVTMNSSTINVSTSAALSQDVITNTTIAQIPNASEKLAHRYSILVKEYALTQDAYNFWAMLKKNTQQIGTIFDAQPSASATNLHCTSDPSRPVLGYISASTITQKRIFIDAIQVPNWFYTSGLNCKADTSCWPKVSVAPQLLSIGFLVPLAPIVTAGVCVREQVPSYAVPVADNTCVDCRLHLGGKTQKPVFWK